MAVVRVRTLSDISKPKRRFLVEGSMSMDALRPNHLPLVASGDISIQVLRRPSRQLNVDSRIVSVAFTDVTTRFWSDDDRSETYFGFRRVALSRAPHGQQPAPGTQERSRASYVLGFMFCSMADDLDHLRIGSAPGRGTRVRELVVCIVPMKLRNGTLALLIGVGCSVV